MSKSVPKTETEDPKTVNITKAQQTAVDGLSTWSAKMRYLDSEGYSRSEIARTLGKRYQHVRNVLTSPAPKTQA